MIQWPGTVIVQLLYRGAVSEEAGLFTVYTLLSVTNEKWRADWYKSRSKDLGARIPAKQRPA